MNSFLYGGVAALIFWLIVFYLLIFSPKSWISIKMKDFFYWMIYKKEIKKERIKSISTKEERTDEYRLNYVKKYKNMILERAEQIESAYYSNLQNEIKIDFFRRKSGQEVIDMWEEDFKRLQLAQQLEIGLITDKQQEQPSLAERTNQSIKDKIKMIKAGIKTQVVGLGELEEEKRRVLGGIDKEKNPEKYQRIENIYDNAIMELLEGR